MKKFMSIVKDLNLKDVKPHTIVSLLAMILSYINMGLLQTGKPIIDIGTDELNFYVGLAYTIIITIYGWYKNHSITTSAQCADDILYKMRDGKLTIDEVVELTNKYANTDVVVKVKEDLFDKELDSATEGVESENEEG